MVLFPISCPELLASVFIHFHTPVKTCYEFVNPNLLIHLWENKSCAKIESDRFIILQYFLFCVLICNNDIHCPTLDTLFMWESRKPLDIKFHTCTFSFYSELCYFILNCFRLSNGTFQNTTWPKMTFRLSTGRKTPTNKQTRKADETTLERTKV